MSTPVDWIADVVSALAPLATAAEASAVLRTSPRNLRRLIIAGRITAVRACEGGSSRVLIPRAEIDRFLRACAGEEPAPVARVKRAPVERVKRARRSA